MRTRSLALWAFLALAVLPGFLRAADEKASPPTMVFRVASLDDLIADARWIATQAGREEEAKQAEAMLKLYTGDKGLEGLDTKRPMGGYAFLGPNLVDSQVVLMLPVADETTFTDMLKRLALKAEKDEDGSYSLQADNVPVPFYFRFVNKYLYATAGEKKNIDPKGLLTADKVFPAGKIGTMSATFNLEGTPKAIREMVLGQAEMRMAEMKEKQGSETAAQQNFRVRLVDEMAGILKSLLEDGGTVTMQAKIDRQANDMSMSLALEPTSGTPLAKRIQALAKNESVVASVITSDAAASFRTTMAMPTDLQKAMGPLFDEITSQAVKSTPDATARALAGRYLQLLAPTIKAGKVDAAGAIVGPSAKKHYTMIAATRFEKALDLEKAIRETVEQLPPDVKGKITIDADKSGDVNIHKLEVAADLDAKAREMFGENPVFFAVREDAIYFAMGDQAESKLKAAVTASAKNVPIAQMQIALARMAPLMAEEQKAAPEAAREAFTAKGSDRVTVSITGGSSLQVQASMKGAVIRFFSLIDQAEKSATQDK